MTIVWPLVNGTTFDTPLAVVDGLMVEGQPPQQEPQELQQQVEENHVEVTEEEEEIEEDEEEEVEEEEEENVEEDEEAADDEVDHDMEVDDWMTVRLDDVELPSEEHHLFIHNINEFLLPTPEESVAELNTLLGQFVASMQ